MGFLSGQNNRFKFEFPKIFVPQEIDDKYLPLLKRIPGNMVTESVVDFINYSIKSVEMNLNPETYEPIEQKDRGTPYARLSRSDSYPDLLWNRDLTITFQLDAAYLIWFIMCDLWLYYYVQKDKYIPKSPGIQILDQYENVLYRVLMQDMLYTGVSGLEFDYSNRSIDQQVITATFRVSRTTLDIQISKP